MSAQNGGPAFPVPRLDAPAGMSLRDWFAGQALAGIASQYHEHWAPDRVGPVCYELADAMLEARNK